MRDRYWELPAVAKFAIPLVVMVLFTLAGHALGVDWWIGFFVACLVLTLTIDKVSD